MRLLKIFIIILLLAVGTIYCLLTQPNPHKEDFMLSIRQGDSLQTVTDKLVSNNIVCCSKLFYTAGRFMGISSALKAGLYRVPPHTNILQVLEVLKNGKSIPYKITILEGLTTQQVLESLERYALLDPDEVILPREGSLFPSTYIVAPGTKYSTLFQTMEEKMATTLAELWAKRKPNLPLKTPHEAVVLASIVERETSLPEERPLVASVYINRLRKGMRLQADPTAIYGLSLGYGRIDRPLTKKDMQHNSAYNTYIIKGLPPTAIANPGRAALEAVLVHPADTDSLFFVATGQGGHHFSKTYDVHTGHVKSLRALTKQKQKAVVIT
jgi:UPF0755 protein